MSNLDEFKTFVKAHPKLKDEVLLKKRTWQEIYETWMLTSEDSFKDYEVPQVSTDAKKETKDGKETKETKKESAEDVIKSVVGYVKKINPDNVTKYVTSIQKVLELLASFGAGATASQAAKKNTGDPLFDRRYDDWY